MPLAEFFYNVKKGSLIIMSKNLNNENKHCTANIYDQFTIRLQSFIVSQFPSTVIGSALPLVVL